jgi:hypothetical protein
LRTKRDEKRKWKRKCLILWKFKKLKLKLHEMIKNFNETKNQLFISKKKKSQPYFNSSQKRYSHFNINNYHIYNLKK